MVSPHFDLLTSHIEEYLSFINIGQTHSHATHNKYYLKSSESAKRKRYDAGTTLQTIFQQHIQTAELAIEAERYATIVQSMPHVVLPVQEFGTARLDLNKPGKRYEWTTQEISHLQHFIQNELPHRSASEQKFKYATCLAYLNEANQDIQKDFHPHHVQSSGRLKFGYDAANERLQGMVRSPPTV